MATVVLDRLTKHYDRAEHPAVKAVSLDIAHGEFMVLLGPSGCGKTTTLRMVAGLESISGGTLSIDGQSMNSVPAKDRDIAMVFQSYALYPHMSVAENLAFGLKRRNIPRAEIEARVRSVAEKIGLTPYLERRPHALSGGSASVLPWAGPSCANPRFSSLMSRFRTLTHLCVPRHARR